MRASQNIRVELNREVKDERIVDVLVRLIASASWRTALNYYSESKKFEVVDGILSQDLYSISAEVPFRLMVSLVEEALKNGKSKLTFRARLSGSADNSHCRDIQTAECIDEVTIWLNLEGEKPTLALSALEFYNLLCNL